MKNSSGMLLLLVVAFGASSLRADTIEMKDNKILRGKFLGADAQAVRFQSGAEMHVINIQDILSIKFAEAARPSPPGNLHVGGAGVSGERSTGASASVSTTIPAGTRLVVKMDDAVDSSHDTPGKCFSGKLQQDIIVTGRTVVPVGSSVTGQLIQSQPAGRSAGQSSMNLLLTQFIVNGQRVPVFTEDAVSGADGQKAARRSGAVVIGGNDLRSGAVLEFRLMQPTTIGR